MTDAEKDAAWRSLPEDFKREVRHRYAKVAFLADNENLVNTTEMLLSDLFGKHNLTATEEPIQDKTMNKEELLKLRKECGKQTLNIGDKVRAISASGKPLYDGKVATIIEKGMSCNEVYYGLYIEGVTVEKRSTPLIGKSEIIGNTSFLAPFFAEDLELVTSRAEEQEQVDGRQEVVDMTLKTWLNSTPDWLAYRMELAKEVAYALIASNFDIKEPMGIVRLNDTVVNIVDGIVERLKGGEK